MAKKEPTRAEREELEGPGIDLNPELEGEETSEPQAASNSVAAPAKPPAEPQPAIELPKSNKQTEPPPICPACNVNCVAGHSEPLYTWYKCSNPQCPIGTRGYTEKKLRPFARAKMLQARRRTEPDEPYAAR